MEEAATVDVRETKLWASVLARGCIALLFAMLAIGTHLISVELLAWLFAGYVLLDGALELYGAVRFRRMHLTKRGWDLVAAAVIAVVVAVLAVVFPTLRVLRIVGGLRGVGIGAADVLWSRRGDASDLFEMSGVVAFLLGLLILAWPGPGTVALPWLLGLSALIPGALDFAGALSELRRLDDLSSEPQSRTA